MTSRSGMERNGAEEIVISGISCRLPESDNMQEFRDNLMNGVDMVTEDDRRWKPGIHGLPRRTGKIKDLSKFDAAFFGVHPKQSSYMDPQHRILLEVAYEAIVDAGVDPNSIRGSNTGVFVGAQMCESMFIWMDKHSEGKSGYMLPGTVLSMLATRMSFIFDFRGPSYSIDTACSSTMYAFSNALQSIRNGDCDAAIVGGVTIDILPEVAETFTRLGMTSPDGKCKHLDNDANGYVRSEGITAVYLQKKKDAKRIYCFAVHAKTNCDGHKTEGITVPSAKIQKQLLIDTYIEAGINPLDVTYLEAHGTGTPIGDPKEVKAVCEAMCKDRNGPLMIGSVKSNMGHCECASGGASLAKVIIAMEEKVIPANLHFKTPNENIPELQNGKLQVVCRNTGWKGGYTGVNSFGFGGANAHVILKSNDEPVIEAEYRETVRLFVYGSRTKEGVDHILKAIETNPNNMYFHKLLNETACMPVETHPYRGYTMLNSGHKKDIVKVVSPGIRPVWFVFSGMGSQWKGMGRQLMEIDVFRESVIKLHAFLKPYSVDLYDCLMNEKDEMFTDVVNTFVGIISMQIALVELLKCVGISPDGIVGHSIGEVACAYADGCLTAEEAVLTAYWRGMCIKNANLPPGTMAAVGLTWEAALNQCPPGVVPACHNAEDSVTVSGPAEDVNNFVTGLQEKTVFAKKVNSNGIAFHSYFMNEVAEDLQKVLDKVITPKMRTSRWVSSSFPKSEWLLDMAKMSSAEYFVHNLVSPVLFHEAVSHVPNDSVVIEIAPHNLLLPVLKRSLGTKSCILGLMKRNSSENIKQCLSSLGTCFQMGINLDPLKLSASVPFPVPCGTPMISPLIKWDHSQSWEVPQYLASKKEYSFDVDLTSKDSDDYYLLEHKIDGRSMLPGASLIFMVWQALAEREGKEWNEMPVMFKDFIIHRATYLKLNDKLHFYVEIIQGTDRFQVTENDMVIASGTVSVPDHKQASTFFRKKEITENLVIPTDLTPQDIYKDCRLKGYEYGPRFQGLLGADLKGTHGVLKWTDNWTTFIDAVTHLGILCPTGLSLPVRYSTIVIDPVRQRQSIVNIDNTLQGTVCLHDDDTKIREAGGVYFKDLIAAVVRRKAGREPTHEAYTFISYSQLVSIDEDEVGKYTDVSDLASYILSILIEQGLPLDDKLKRSVTIDRAACSKYEGEANEHALCNSTKEQHNYLNFLKNINAVVEDKDFKEKMTYLINSQLKDERLDLLLENLLQTKYLKLCIDIVTENIHSLNLRVAGIGNVGMIDSVNELINAQSFFHSSCTIVSDVPQANDVEQGLKYQDVVVWTPEKSIPDVLQRSHLVVVNHALRKYRNLSKALAGLSDLLDDGGYLLIQEVTANFHIAVFEDNAWQSTESYFDDLDRRTCSIYCDANTWKQYFAEEGFIVVQEISDNFLTSLFLVKKRVQNSTELPAILTITENDFGWMEELQSKLKSIHTHGKEDRIWLKNDDNVCGILGLVNCLRREPGGDRIRCVFNIDDHKTLDNKTMNSLIEKDLVMNVYLNGAWGSYRHTALKPVEPVPSEYAYVNVQNRGAMSSLSWFQSPLRYISHRDTDNCQIYDVRYASLNFRDVMLATGKLSAEAIPESVREGDCLLGMEFSGTDEKHNRVMGLVPHQGIATKVKVGKNNVWPVPEGWTLEQAATVPVVYFTAYYALVVRARIRAKHSVLIHAGSGGVGQAAITLALHYGCKVFTTVGSKEKRDYLKERFPELDEKNIFSSRDTIFESGIQKATAGRGVDIVLNSLADEKLQSSVKVVAEHGHFLEIGKFDLAQNSSLGMSVFLKNITFHGILTDALFEEDNEELIMAAQCLSEGIKTGTVKPLQTIVFNTDQVEDAFRYMAQGKHIGKVLIKVGDHSRPVYIPALPRTYFDPVKTYVITGGLGGFGLELTSWMIERGARIIILTSRSGKIKTGYQARQMKIFHDLGAKVSVSSANVCDFQETETFLQSTDTQIGGIFHLAVVLGDNLLENQTAESFESVCNPKVTGVKNLDQLTRNLCKNSLDWFIVFSSIASGRGSIGQSNYGLANSVMERVCEQRVRDGLPGLAIQWGPIGDVGVFIDTVGGNETVAGGTMPQRILSCLESLDFLLHQKIPVVSSFVPAEKEQTEIRKTTDNLMQTICKIMGITDQTANANTSFGDLGMDSLISVEIKVILDTDYNINLSSKEIKELTLSKLKILADGPVSRDNEENTDSRKADKLMAHLVKTYLAASRPTNYITKLNDINKGFPLFIVHDLLGTTNHLDHVVSQLKIPVYGLMRTADLPEANLVDTAACYVKAIKSVCPNGEPFHLAGYSFGAIVAQEMALRFQDGQSSPSSLILLDGSSSMVYIPDDIQVNATVKLHLAAIGVDVDFIVNLRARPEQEEQVIGEKIERVLTELKEMKTDVTADDIRTFISIYLTAVNSMCQYQPDKIYESDVTLIAAEESIRLFGKEPKSAVGKFTSGEVTVKPVSGNHFTFIRDESGDEVANFINRCLLPDDMNKLM